MTITTGLPVVLKHLTTPEARQLEELCVLKTDLDISFRTMALYFSRYPFAGMVTFDPAVTEHIISMSLYRDAIVLYSGCFTKKSEKGKLIPKAVYGHLPNWEKLYQHLQDVRDSFAAHNFGAHRQHDICVGLVLDGGEWQVGPINNVVTRLLGALPYERDKILGFINVAREHVEALIKPLNLKLEEVLAGMSQEELQALPEPEMSVPGDDEILLSRKEYRAKAGRAKKPMPLNLKARKLGDS